MSEFHMAGAHSQQAYTAQQYRQPAPNVEWYAPQATSNSNFASSYAFDQGFAANSGAAYGSFDEEPPLLEELGIDIPAILSRTKSILTFRLSGHDVDSLDLGGPLILMAILGCAHLLAGKLHFGYILGWTVLGSILIWFVLSSMAGNAAEGRALDVYSCCCLLGYCLLPMVLHALVSLLLPRRSRISLGLAVGAVAWAAQTAAKLFVHRTPALRGQLPLVIFPCVLMYAAFALLTLY